MDKWLRQLSLVSLVMVVTLTIMALGAILVITVRQTQDNRQAIADLRVQNRRQNLLLIRGQQVLCQASFNALIIDKALRNLGQQAGLNVAGIPNRLPPETEQLCADLSSLP